MPERCGAVHPSFSDFVCTRPPGHHRWGKTNQEKLHGYAGVFWGVDGRVPADPTKEARREGYGEGYERAKSFYMRKIRLRDQEVERLQTELAASQKALRETLAKLERCESEAEEAKQFSAAVLEGAYDLALEAARGVHLAPSDVQDLGRAYLSVHDELREAAT